MYKKVIFTSIVGNYDPLLDHSYVMKGWDYICFVDKIPRSNKSELWQYRLIPKEIDDKIRRSRVPKILPHSFLSDYKYSIYIDANIDIVDDTLEKRVNELIEKGVKIAIAPHPDRDCVYDEANFCIQVGKDKKSVIEKQMKEVYKANNFPVHFGLFQNNLIFRQHNELTELNQLWWNIYSQYSRRDQLSLVYALWQKKIKCEKLFDNGFHIQKSPAGFRFFAHEVAYTTKKSIYLRNNVRLLLKRIGLLKTIQKLKQLF